MHHIFVYGTLKAGFPNSRYNVGSRVSGEFCTVRPFGLYLVGERASPWLIARDDCGSNAQKVDGQEISNQIIGQLFVVDDHGLKVMDELERISDVDGYKRTAIEIMNKQTDQVTDVYVYLKSAAQLAAEKLKSELLTEYSLQDALLYSSRKLDS